MRKRRKQVIITGAGASIPYGFPSGDRLLRDIATNFLTNYTSFYTRKHVKIGLEHTEEYRLIKDLVNTLNGIKGISIDKFLNLNQKFLTNGVEAICAEIIRYERNSINFMNRLKSTDEDWYTYLFSKMLDGLDNIEEIKEEFHNNISIITFNYDRSLEFFLYENLIKILKNSGIDQSEIANIVQSLPIIHLYGKIGKFPLEKDALANEVLPYGGNGEFYYEDAKLISNQINIIYQNRIDNTQINTAIEKIKTAERILIIGFGFDQFNIDLLNLKEVLQNRVVCASAFKTTENERARISKALCPNNHSMTIVDCNNQMLLREYLLF